MNDRRLFHPRKLGPLASPVLSILLGCGGATFEGAPGDSGGGHEGGVADTGRPDASADTGVIDGGSRVDSGAEGGGAVDSGHDASSGPCPSTRPPAGEACADDGLACEYGDDPDVTCDALVTCTGGAWALTGGPPPSSACSRTNVAACPAAFGDVVQGATCPTVTECYYPQARCQCAACIGGLVCAVSADGGLDPTWSCDVPPPPTGCPIPRPRIGSSCGDFAEPDCDYGNCQGGIEIACKGGIWVQTFTPCPL